MFCHKCGSKLVDDSIFCSKCGAKLPTDAAINPVAADTPKPTIKAHTTSFSVCSNVLAKWSDGLYYFGIITDVKF